MARCIVLRSNCSIIIVLRFANNDIINITDRYRRMEVPIYMAMSLILFELAILFDWDTLL